MPTLTEAREAHDRAQSVLQDARTAERDARAAVETLRSRIADGDPKATSSALAAATAEVEHATLAAAGAERGVADLYAAVRAAEADAACDAIIDRLPALGSAVMDSLEDVLDALAPFVAAATAYDQFVEESAQRLALRHHDFAARVRIDRFGPPTIDGRRLESCRGPSQLADVLLPYLRDLGAPAAIIEPLKFAAAGAPAIPTDRKDIP